MSASQTWSGLSATKFRASRLGATGRWWRRSVVRGVRRRPRRAESPISRISRATRRRECRRPSRRSSAWIHGAPRAQLTGADAEFRRHLRQPLVAVQQPLHRLRLELPREAPSSPPRRHLALLGCLGSLANPPAPGGSPTPACPASLPCPFLP